MHLSCALQADEAHFLVTALVSKRMSLLLEMFTPHLSNATVRTAVHHLAVGMGGFKSEEVHMASDAAAVLPLVHKFITAMLPHCNTAFNRASTDQTCRDIYATFIPDVKVVCEVLVLAIKTFESALEVTLRCEVQTASELSRYASCSLNCADKQCPLSSSCPANAADQHHASMTVLSQQQHIAAQLTACQQQRRSCALLRQQELHHDGTSSASMHE